MPAVSSISRPAEPIRIHTAPPLPRRESLLRWLDASPLMPPALGMASGILIDDWVVIPFWVACLLFSACGVLLLCAAVGELRRYLVIAAAAACLGAMLHDVELRRFRSDHVARFCAEEPIRARVTGTVLNAPVVRAVQSGRIDWIPRPAHTRFVLDVDIIAGVSGDLPASGSLAVIVREPLEGVSPGDRIEILGQLYRVPPPSNPGERDWCLISRRAGILAQLSCEHAASVVRRSSGNGWRHSLHRVRRRATSAMLDETLPGDVPGARLLEALVLGQRSAVDSQISDDFIRTGTIHYLSVSGSHVGMLASVVWLLGTLAGRSRRGCATAALLLLTGYAVLTEANAPVIRSAIMGDLLCIGILKRRPPRAANWLAASALVLLIIGPNQLFDPSFQMSFLTIAALIYLSPPVHRLGRSILDVALRRTDPLLQPEIQRLLHPPSRLRMVLDTSVSVFGWWLAIGMAAWLVGTVLGAYHFRQFSMWGWLNTIIIMPLIWIVLVLGLAKTVLAFLLAPLGAVLGPPLGSCTTLLIRVVGWLAHLPASGIPTPAVPLWLATGSLLMLLAWILAPWLRLSRRWMVVSLVLFATAGTWAMGPRHASSALKLYVLAVGDGTSCAILLPDGRTMLYDMGSRPPYDLQRWTVGPLLALERVYSIDTLILSHPDLDHVSGVPDLLEHHRVRRVATTSHFDALAWRDGPGGRVKAEIEGAGIARECLVQGDTLCRDGSVIIEVLWPPVLASSPRLTSNDSSMVLRITYAGHRILLCGDIEDAPQRRLIATNDLRADVLVLPHHGGVVSSTDAFIRAVAPRCCIRSCGQRASETRNGIAALVGESEYLCTADDGAIVVTLTPAAMEVRPWRSAAGP